MFGASFIHSTKILWQHLPYYAVFSKLTYFLALPAIKLRFLIFAMRATFLVHPILLSVIPIITTGEENLERESNCLAKIKVITALYYEACLEV